MLCARAWHMCQTAARHAAAAAAAAASASAREREGQVPPPTVGRSVGRSAAILLVKVGVVLRPVCSVCRRPAFMDGVEMSYGGSQQPTMAAFLTP